MGCVAQEEGLEGTAGAQGLRGSISHGPRGAKGSGLVKARAGSGLLGGPASPRPCRAKEGLPCGPPSEWKNSRHCSLTPDSAHRRQLCVNK